MKIINININPEKERELFMKLSELLAANESLVGQLNKVEVEIVTRLNDLQTAIDKLTLDLEDVDLTIDQENSVAEVQAAAQRLDDIIPDPIPGPIVE